MRYKDLLQEYLDTKTSEFLQWFGDSKVVDRDGKPLMLFHGTMVNFSIETFHDMSHFGTSTAANDRLDFHINPKVELPSWNSPHIYPVYLRIENPLLLTDLVDWNESNVWLELAAMGWFPESGGDFYKMMDEIADQEKDPWDYIKSSGFDGVTYQNAYEDKGSTSWITFSGSQVRNAF